MPEQPQNQPLHLADISCSATPNFLIVAVNDLLTYRTPKEIIDYLESEKVKAILGNPPYDVEGD